MFEEDEWLYEDVNSDSGRLRRIEGKLKNTEEKLNRIEKLLDNNSKQPKKRLEERPLFNSRGFPCRPMTVEEYKRIHKK